MKNFLLFLAIVMIQVIIQGFIFICACFAFLFTLKWHREWFIDMGVRVQ